MGVIVSLITATILVEVGLYLLLSRQDFDDVSW